MSTRTRSRSPSCRRAPAPTRVERLPNDLAKLRRFCERLAARGEVRACYEASGAGYVTHRAMRDWGYPCDVIAPSLIPTKPGQQRKHDTYDAAQLARLYRAGELTTIRISSEAEERVRDLVRRRETLQKEVLASRHYILKFLARRELVYREGTNWSTKHYVWLRGWPPRARHWWPKTRSSTASTWRCSSTSSRGATSSITGSPSSP